MQPALLQKYPDYARNPQDEEHQLSMHIWTPDSIRPPVTILRR